MSQAACTFKVHLTIILKAALHAAQALFPMDMQQQNCWVTPALEVKFQNIQ